MLKYMSGVSLESVVDVYAKVVKPEVEIQSCTQKVELHVQRVHVVSRSAAILPFTIEDASRLIDKNQHDDELNEEEKKDDSLVKDEKNIRVAMKTRLDNRIIDLRTPAKNAIFKVQSGVCQLFREFLLDNDFMEIHTPKLIGGASEGGSNVFKLGYFGK
jgi:nondiscriminating aspartyl-tRNA synthetase